MRFFSLLSFCMIVLAGGAFAQVHISVDTVQRYFLEGEKKFQTLRVSNNHPTDTFEIGSELLIYKNILDRSSVDSHKAEFEPVKGHFLMAPKKFVLAPGKTRSVRLVHTKAHDENEYVYRVAFKPNPIVEEGVNDEDAQGVKPNTRVVTAAGMLVLASPKDPVLNIDYQRDENSILFSNTGNIAADFHLTKKYCYSSDEGSNCMELPGKRLYPGEKWRFNVSGSIPIKWSVSSYRSLRKWLDIDSFDAY